MDGLFQWAHGGSYCCCSVDDHDIDETHIHDQRMDDDHSDLHSDEAHHSVHSDVVPRNA